MLQRKEEELVKRQTVERRALPKRIRAERKARDMMFRESLRISTNLDPDGEREKLKKVNSLSLILILIFLTNVMNINCSFCSSKNKKRNVIHKNNNVLTPNMLNNWKS